MFLGKVDVRLTQKGTRTREGENRDTEIQRKEKYAENSNT